MLRESPETLAYSLVQVHALSNSEGVPTSLLFPTYFPQRGPAHRELEEAEPLELTVRRETYVLRVDRIDRGDSPRTVASAPRCRKNGKFGWFLFSQRARARYGQLMPEAPLPVTVDDPLLWAETSL